MVEVRSSAAEIGGSLRASGEEGNVRIDITSAALQLASSDSVFGSRGWVFRVNLSDEDIAAVGTAPRGRLSILLFGAQSSFAMFSSVVSSYTFSFVFDFLLKVISDSTASRQSRWKTVS